MRYFLSRFYLAGCLLSACCVLCHCSTRQPIALIHQTTEQAKEASRLMQKVLDTNRQVDTVKGIGSVKIMQDGHVTSFRAAWMGSQPNKFRMEVLASTGQPILSFASDGKRNYLLSYADNRLFKRKASEKGLERFISIVISPEDILDLLSGRFPVCPESRATIEYPDGNRSPVLVLYDHKRGYREKIYPKTKADSTSYRIERYDRKGRLKYRAVSEKVREIEDARIPEQLTISNENGAMIQIDIKRCWVNPVVSEDRFVLNPPN